MPQAGQSRRQPASTTRLGVPQLAQNRCRACQPSTAFASASGGRCSGGEEPAHRDRAQVGDEEIVAGLERFDGGFVDAGREPRRAVEQAEEHFVAPRRERSRFDKSESGVTAIVVRIAQLVRDDDLPADEMDARPRVGLERGDGRGVLPPIGGAIERVRGIAEERRDPEIRA